MVLSNPEGASLEDDTGEGTITDDDQPPGLAIDDAPPVVEGSTAEFVVRLSAVSGLAVTVDFETVDGTAKAGSDYTAASGRLTFTAGETAKTISVATLDDTVPEAEEGFTVVLSNPSGARLEDDTGEGTIIDDDQPPGLAIDDAPPVVEGGTAEFVVRLSAVSGLAVTVDFETVDGTAEGGFGLHGGLGDTHFPTRRDGPEHRGGCAGRRNLGGGGGLHGGPEQPGGGQSGR